MGFDTIEINLFIFNMSFNVRLLKPITSLPKKKICLNPNRYNFWIEEVERKGQVNEPEVEYAEIRMTGGMGISVEEPENRSLLMKAKDKIKIYTYIWETGVTQGWAIPRFQLIVTFDSDCDIVCQ